MNVNSRSIQLNIVRYRRFKTPIVLLLVFIIAFGIMAPLHSVHAWGFDIAKAALNVLEAILKGIEFLTRYLLLGFAKFFQLVLVDFSKEVGFFDNKMVKEGWKVVRDLTNMFFVVFLAIIAIATIMRNETYGMKALLPKLIIVALLINFSLVLTGIVVNVAQLFMVFFTDTLMGQYDDIGSAIANGLLIGKYTENPDFYTMGVEGDTKDLMEVLNLAIAIIFEVIAAFVFLFLAIMLIIRIVMLWVLLILSPLAFGAAILPATRGFTTMWTKHFTNWTLFGVFTAFFIWLATYLIFYMTDKQIGYTAEMIEKGGATAIVAFGGFMLQYLAIIIFLIAGVSVAMSMSGGIGQQVSTRIRRGARTIVGIGARPPRAAAGLAAARARRETERRAGAAAGKASGYAAQVARGERGIVSKIPLAGWTAKQMVEPLARFEARVGRDIDKEASEIAKLPDERARDIATTTTEPIKKIGAYIDMARRGMLSEKYGFKDEEIRKVMPAAKTYFREKELAMAKPDVAKEVFKWSDAELEKHMAKYTRATASRMAVEALDNEDIQKAIIKTWGNQQALGMVEEGRRDQIEAFEKAIRNMTKAAGDFNATMDMIETAYNNPGLKKSLINNPALKVLNIR